MASICFFASHYQGRVVPEYIRVYLDELAKKFDRTILLCEDEPDADSVVFFKDKGIEHLIVKNEGYDFGKWHQAFQRIGTSQYDTVGLINDSSVLFAPLDRFWNWLNSQKSEVVGMTKSNFRGEHVQSYFLVLRGRAVAAAKKHFEETGLVKDYNEVITRYELALNARFLREGLTLSGFVNNGGYDGEFSPYYKCVEHHLKQGIPLIKKRILLSDYRDPELFTLARMNFVLSPSYYASLIGRHTSQLIFDPFKLVRENKMNLMRRVRYELTRFLINSLRPFKRLGASGKK